MEYQYKFILCQNKFNPLVAALGGNTDPKFTLILEKDLKEETAFTPIEIKDFENVYYLVLDLSDNKLSYIPQSEQEKNPGRYQLLSEDSFLFWVKENLGGYYGLVAMYENEPEKFSRILSEAVGKGEKTSAEIKEIRKNVKKISERWKFRYEV
jgi:hypothetical protein